MVPLSERSRAYDVGVLLVHGIGEQQKGETLLEAGHALVEVLRKRLKWLPPSGKRATQLAPQVELESIQLHRDNASEPAQAEIRLDNIGHLRPIGYPFSPQSTSRWLIAESWWAECFPPPSYSSVFGWVVKILPGTIVTHFDRRLRRTFFEINNPDNLQAPGIKYLRLVRDLVLLALAAIVVPPLLCGLTAALLVGFLPIPFAETIARAIQRILATIVGDSYALLGNPLLGSAIVDTVRQHIRRLGDRCQRVVVIAHSQGGAIAHAAVRKDPLIDCEVLITYGSGLHKLTLVEQLSSGRTSLLWLAVFSLFIASSIVITLLVSWTWLGIWLLASLGFFVAGCASLVLWFHTGGREFSREKQSDLDRVLFERKFELHNERVGWFDVYSSDDPVPNGPLLDEYSPPYSRLRTHVTCNLGSMLFDHTSYWQNHDDFVSRIARMLLFRAFIDVEHLDVDDHDRQLVATDRRRWRVAWRRAGGWVAMVATLSVARRLWSEPPLVAERGHEWLGRAVRELPILGTWLAPPGTVAFHSPAGVLLFLVFFAALSWILLRRWQAWNQHEEEDFFEKNAYRLMPTAMRIYLGWLTGTLFLGTSALYGLAPFYLAAALALILAITVAADRAGWITVWEGVRTRSVVGTLNDVRTGWQSRQQQWLNRQSSKGRRVAIFELGLKLVESQSRVDQVMGVKALRRAIQLEVRNAGWWLGRHLEEKGDLQGAKGAYEAGRKLEDPMAAYYLGILLAEKLNDPDAAVAAYKHAAEVMKYPPACFSLGLLLDRLERRRESRVAFKLGADLEDPLSVMQLGGICASAARRRAARGTRWSASFLQEAVRHYSHAMRHGEAEAAARLGGLLVESNDVAGAIDAFGAGVRLRHNQCALSLGRLLLREGRRAEAEATFRRAIELTQLAATQGHPHDTTAAFEAAWELGQLLEERGGVDAAQRLYTFAAGSPGAAQGSAAAAIRLARLETAKGRAHRGEPMWRRAIELRSTEAALAYAQWLHGEGRRHDSVEAATHAKEFLSGDSAVPRGQRPSVMVAIGDQLRASGDLILATEMFQLATDQESPEGGMRLVDLIVERSDVARARDLANDVWSLKSTSAKMTLARFLLSEGAPELTRRVLEKTDAGTPEESLAAARIWEALDDSPRAIASYEQAMNEGLLDAVDPLIACLGDGRDPERLERVLQFARTLGYKPATATAV